MHFVTSVEILVGLMIIYPCFIVGLCGYSASQYSSPALKLLIERSFSPTSFQYLLLSLHMYAWLLLSFFQFASMDNTCVGKMQPVLMLELAISAYSVAYKF